MEFVALVLFLIQMVAWFVLPGGKNKVETRESLSSIGDEARTTVAV